MPKTLTEKLEAQVGEGNITRIEADSISSFIFEIRLSAARLIVEC